MTKAGHGRVATSSSHRAARKVDRGAEVPARRGREPGERLARSAHERVFSIRR